MGLGIFISSNYVRPYLDPAIDLPTLVGWFDMGDPASFTTSGGLITSITQKKSGTIWTPATMTGSPLLTFVNVGGTGDTISRNTGSWITDGFAIGETFSVTGSVSNNISNAPIVGISSTVITLGSTALTNESSVSGCVVTGSVAPGYSATGFNSRPGMTFNGSQSLRRLTGESALIAAMQGSTDYTVFVAGKVNTAAAAMAFFGAGSTTNATNANRYFGNNTGGSGVYIGACRSNAGTSVNYSSTAAPDTNANIVEWYASSSVGSIQKNGAAADPNAAAAATGASTPDRVGLGCRPASTPNVLLNGAIGEVIICSSLLSAGLRSDVRSYLGNKWGISVL